MEDLAGPGVVAVTSATGDEPVVPAGEPVPTVPESMLVVAGQERGQHVERGLADEHARTLADEGEVLAFSHLREGLHASAPLSSPALSSRAGRSLLRAASRRSA